MSVSWQAAHPDAVAKRRVMNLVKQDDPAHTPERAGHPGGSTDGGSKERTITFRTRKDMYEPRARQLLSAEEQAEEEAYLASTEVPTVALASESLESGEISQLIFSVGGEIGFLY